MRKGKDPDTDPYLRLLESGSWRPKNMQLLRIRIRIPNTGFFPVQSGVNWDVRYPTSSYYFYSYDCTKH
jgi:hypothetical protein